MEIMQRFFDVLLADMEFIRDNEAMATAFVRLDRLRDRNELGQVSDIDVFRQESIYEKARHQRYASQSRQRSARARLALVLNRPGQLPTDVARPELGALQRKLPEFEELQRIAYEHNPLLQAARLQLDAARSRLASARAGDNPVLSGEFEAAANSREIGSRDRLRLGLTLEIPLTKGGAVEADIAREQAGVRDRQAELAGLEFAVRKAVLDTWLELDNLRISLDEARALQRYRDLYLDRSRALYEMEVTTDLGDSMVEISEAQHRVAEVEYNIALAWARMDALLGRLVTLQPHPAGSASQAGDKQPGGAVQQ
jgi:outer membrane protein TolC